MKLLNRELIEEKGLLGREELVAVDSMPEKILQFGEGKFLRAFLDWMVSIANRQGMFKGKVVIVPPLDDNLVDTINAQDGFFTMLSRGIEAGVTVERRDIVSSVGRVLSPRLQWPDLLTCVEQPMLKIVVSNTTEAGIYYREEPFPVGNRAPESYAARLAALLNHRFCHFEGKPGSGMLILPCELIENNGLILREIVVRHAGDWGLPPAFTEWLEKENLFLNTLVDRIVTGVAEEEREIIWNELGYRDYLLNAGEVFYRFYIEAGPGAEQLFPLHRANLNVEWVKSLLPYRTRKVRLLNGAHTAVMPLALMQGLPTVRDAVEDRLTRKFMERFLFSEVIPVTAGNSESLTREALTAFAQAVLERFENPFIGHYWQDISINSIAKFQTRVMPSFLDYTEQKDGLPPAMTFSLAALLTMYRGGKPSEKGMLFSGPNPFYLQDDHEVLEIFYREWSAAAAENYSGHLEKVAAGLLKESRLWGCDLSLIPGLVKAISVHMETICREGVQQALVRMGDDN